MITTAIKNEKVVLLEINTKRKKNELTIEIKEYNTKEDIIHNVDVTATNENSTEFMLNQECEFIDVFADKTETGWVLHEDAKGSLLIDSLDELKDKCLYTDRYEIGEDGEFQAGQVIKIDNYANKKEITIDGVLVDSKLNNEITSKINAMVSNPNLKIMPHNHHFQISAKGLIDIFKNETVDTLKKLIPDTFALLVILGAYDWWSTHDEMLNAIMNTHKEEFIRLHSELNPESFSCREGDMGKIFSVTCKTGSKDHLFTLYDENYEALKSSGKLVKC